MSLRAPTSVGDHATTDRLSAVLRAGLRLGDSTGVKLNRDGTVASVSKDEENVLRDVKSEADLSTEVMRMAWRFIRERDEARGLAAIRSVRDQDDVLALILDKVSKRNASHLPWEYDYSKNSKSSQVVCQNVKNWCGVDARNNQICNANEQFWQDLAKEVFQYNGVAVMHEKGPDQSLIYLTFKDDEKPREAFEAMCSAKGLADAVAKRFALYAIHKFEQSENEQWVENRAESTGIDESVLAEMSDGEQKNLRAREYRDEDWFEDLETWKTDAAEDFKKSRYAQMYTDMYNRRGMFSKLVDRFFRATSTFLFNPWTGVVHEKDYGSAIAEGFLFFRRNPDQFRTTFDMFRHIGKVIGVGVVCLLKRELDATREFRTESKNLRHVVANLVTQVIVNDDIYPVTPNLDEDRDSFLQDVLDDRDHGSFENLLTK